MTRLKTALLAGISAAGLMAANAQTKLLGDPAIAGDMIAFTYAGDIYVANTDGSDPRRLTSHAADEGGPVFSPDGQTIAFTANYHGQEDVYTISVDGGQPTRHTWHPGDDVAIDWSPDGSGVVFVSRRETNHGRSAQLYSVSASGGLPEKMMDARVFRGELGMDGEAIAYIPFGPAYNGLYGGSAGWRGYRGGTTPSITVMDLDENEARYIDGEGVNDLEPMWMDGKIYFLSDRSDKVFNLHAYDPESGEIEALTDESTWDIRAADADGGAVIFEAGGELKLFDAESGEVETLSITLNPDLPQLQPGWKSVSDRITAASISKSGKRVAITARGEVFSVPVEDGSVRNISDTSGIREYDARFSPDGLQLAHIVETGEGQKLVIEDQSGLGDTKEMDIGSDFYTLRTWTGDGTRIIFEDNKLNVFAMDAESGERTDILTNVRRQWGPGETGISVSPDGRWLAVTKEEVNFNRNLYLFDFEEDELTRITDYMADVSEPAFSRDGKHLFFAASTNSGPSQVGLDMSSQEQVYRAGLYVITLEDGGTSPLAPRTGDEEPSEDNGNDNGDENGENGDADQGITISLDGISDRIEALPVETAAYGDLATGSDGALYYVKQVQPGVENPPPGETLQTEAELIRFDLEKREAKTVTRDVTGLHVSADGNMALVSQSNGRLATAKVGESMDIKPLDLSGLKLYVEPRAEWAQIFNDVWRMQPNFFYDPNLQGLDWEGVRERYEPLLQHVGRREDLNRLLVEMIGEMQAGHNRTGGGDIFRGDSENTGLLGADLITERGRTRIARIYDGENWNPFIDAPLSKPGLDVEAGDYILAVNGRDIGEADNIFAFLARTSGQQTVLTIADSPTGRNARDITIVPTGNEGAMRLWSWVEANRKAVSAATDGRVGYVYLPNTAGAGYTLFNRMFFAQTDKDAMIIDERSNGGGQAANYITDVLGRTYLSGWKDFAGATFRTPGGAMFGPKIMLIDQDAGSGGDFLPYSFREMELGTLMGTRTWGGLIGISTNPGLVDGGFLTVPYFRFFDTDYEWSVENEGVEPDIEVQLDPVLANDGRDSQLEAAVREITRQLRENPSDVPEEAPPYPTELGE